MATHGQKGRAAAPTDPYLLYQLAVQCPEFELAFIEEIYLALRGRKPRSLREDFCGTALSACAWVGRNAKNTAVAYDIDQQVLDWGCQNNYCKLSAEQQQRLLLRRQNVLHAQGAPVEVCQAFNFSYWVFQERATMLEYFRNVRAQLVDDGLFFLDAFGGYEAHKVQIDRREVEDFSYVWEQKKYNAVTAEMECRIHFCLSDGRELQNAFAYTWRLWGVRELREILIDAGFRSTTLYLQEFDELTEEPLDRFICTDYAEDYACWVGYIVAEK